jgi:hypothetical protein
MANVRRDPSDATAEPAHQASHNPSGTKSQIRGRLASRL